MVLAIIKIFETLKSKNTFQRKKIFILSIVGGIFLLLLGWFVWYDNYRDNLVAHVPDDAVLYLHLNVPSRSVGSGFDQMTSQILNDLPTHQSGKLSTSTLEYIGREMAIFGQVKDGELLLSILLKADSRLGLKNLLLNNQIEHQIVSGDVFLIPASPKLLADFALESTGRVKELTSGKFSWRSQIKIYLSREAFGFLSADELTPLLYQLLADKDGNIFADIKLQSGALVALNSQGSISQGDWLLADNFYDADVVLKVNDFGAQVDRWLNDGFVDSGVGGLLSGYGFEDIFTDLSQGLSDGQIYFLAKDDESDQKDWFWSNYHWAFVATASSNKIEQVAGALERLLSLMISGRYPASQVVYLSEGTKVVEFVISPEVFKFDPDGQLELPDDQGVLYLQTSDSEVIIGTSEAMIDEVSREAPVTDNYFKINQNLLPSVGWWKYLNGFESLEVGLNYVILR